MPTFSGNFGILPAHVPTLAVLKPGVINVFEEDGTQKKFFGVFECVLDADSWLAFDYMLVNLDFVWSVPW